MNKDKSCWTQAEDAAIALLFEQRHIEDWNEIARLLVDQYNFPKKNSKQCKGRYMNHLNSSVFKIQWTLEQEKLFMKLHNEIGNKWATIAQHLSGKTDNCVKNHFYSKLRKLLRKLNKIIQFFLKKQFRPIDISIMYKIVQAAQQRFKQNPNCEENVSTQCLNVQNKMLEFAMFKDTKEGQNDDDIKFTPENLEQYKDLIKEIYRVSKLYKRKSKKVRNSLIQAPVNHGKKKAKKEAVKVQQQQDQSQEEEKMYQPRRQKVQNTILVRKHFSEKEDLKDEDVKVQDELSYENQDQKIEKKVPQAQSNGRIQVEEGDGIQQLLRTAGILHDEIKPVKTKNDKNRKYSNSQYNINTPNQSQLNYAPNNCSSEYSPLHSFSSQQMQNFLGFSMVNNQAANTFANFTLSEKSSFKSYSQRDPSQIDNPFFDEYSSNNARMMFPMNFNLPPQQQYQQVYQPQQYSNNYQYQNMYYPQQNNEDNNNQQYRGQEKR